MGEGMVWFVCLFVSELVVSFVCEENVIEDGDESWGKEVAV
jgi:hypothetical protein